MRKLVEINVCPNCGGKVKEIEGGVFVCENCRSEFEVENNDPETAKERDDNAFCNPDWFVCTVPEKKLHKGPCSRKMLETFIHCVDEIKDSGEILKYLRTKTREPSAACTKDNHPEWFQAFVKRAGRVLEADEEPILYANTAMLSKAKDGILVTDRRTVVIRKGKVTQVPHDEIYSVVFDVEYDSHDILINNIKGMKIKSLVDTEDAPPGALLALICALAFERNPNREKITLAMEDYDAEF